MELSFHDPGDLIGIDGFEMVLMTLDEAFYKESDSDLFERLEAAIFGEPRKARETCAHYTLRMQSAHHELYELRPSCLDDTLRGYLLLRNASSTEAQKENVLCSIGCDYSWSNFALLFKRMSEETVGGQGSASAFLARIEESSAPPVRTRAELVSDRTLGTGVPASQHFVRYRSVLHGLCGSCSAGSSNH